MYICKKGVGNSVTITDKINEKKKYKVVVTFIEELPDENIELRNFSAQTNGLDFWKDSAEDLYQDYLDLDPPIKA